MPTLCQRRAVETRRPTRRGAELFEMAIVMPVLLFFMFGLVEFGQYFYIRSAFQAAARDATRSACLSTAAQGDPATKAASTLAQANVVFNPAWMTITDVTTATTVADCSTVMIGDRLQVTIQCPYSQVPNAFRPLYALTGKGIGAGKTCSGQCTMYKEGP